MCAVNAGKRAKTKGSGIYVIENLLDHKVYLGSAVILYKRRQDHFEALGRHSHINFHLQRAWNKYGEASFSFWVLEEVEDKSRLIEREQYFLNLFHDYSFGLYNICRLAGSPLGTKRTLESRQRMREAKVGKSSWNRGVPHSPETCQKISDALKGFKHSEGTRQKMRSRMLNFKHSEEAKRKIGDAVRRRWEKIHGG